MRGRKGQQGPASGTKRPADTREWVGCGRSCACVCVSSARTHGRHAPSSSAIFRFSSAFSTVGFTHGVWSNLVPRFSYAYSSMRRARLGWGWETARPCSQGRQGCVGGQRTPSPRKQPHSRERGGVGSGPGATHAVQGGSAVQVGSAVPGGSAVRGGSEWTPSSRPRVHGAGLCPFHLQRAVPAGFFGRLGHHTTSTGGTRSTRPNTTGACMTCALWPLVPSGSSPTSCLRAV